MAITILLDRKTPANSRILIGKMLKAAFLAREETGDIQLEMEGEMLVAIPTGSESDWPRASLEARLACTDKRSVEDIVFDWISEQSRDPGIGPAR